MNTDLRSAAKTARRLLVVFLSLGLAAALASGCSQRTGTTGQGPATSTPPPFTPGGATSPRAHAASGVGYFVSADEKVVPARVDAAAGDTEAVVRALLTGVTDEAKAAGYSSAIPAGTTLRSLSIETSTAVVDLSDEFGSGGGSASMQMRVAQVVFTLTRDPAITKVSFKMDGEPITALGGEGLVLSAPQTRADWEDFSPAILIESPVLNDTVSGEFIARGTANVFEAQLRLEMQDAEGRTRTTHKVTATSGTGTRGSFVASETVSYIPGDAGYLVGVYISPKDGSRIVSMRVPLAIE